MTATNHALTGALIGLAVTNPVLAVPLALTSHFALDSLPHFGSNDKKFIGKDNFVVLLICEAAACFALVLLLCLTRPHHWVAAAVCAFVAASPDFMWIPEFIRARKGLKKRPKRHVLRFHSLIQWFQRPIGVVVELAWFISFGYLVLKRL